MQLDNSILSLAIVDLEEANGAERSSTLSISSANSMDSGDYICVVVVTIPDSYNLEERQTSTVTIRGTYCVRYNNF